MANEQNLRPIKKGQLSNDELKKRQRNGGKKSVEVRREKKLLSQFYAEAIAEANNLDGKGKNLKDVIKESLAKGNVQMFKEVREGTEGSKAEITIKNDYSKIKEKLGLK